MSDAGLEILKIALSAIGGGILSIVMVMLKRKWEKDDKNDQIMVELKKTNEKIDSLQKTFTQEIENLKKSDEEYRAKQSRARILQFNDELIRKTLHTRESFADVISEIDFYENYCAEYPLFPNFKAVAAIENIKTVYKKRLQENDFLS